MRAWAVTVSVTALLVAGLVAGCSDTSGDGNPSAPDVTVTTTVSDTNEPAPEPTGPESSQPEVKKPSIDVASLPIGGSPIDGSPNCTSVSLTDTSIPAGTTITLGAPEFEPQGVFDADQSACPGDHPACEGVQWTADAHDTCYVGVKQLIEEGTTTLRVPGKAVCATQDDCDSLQGRSGSQILLTALPRETPTGG